MLGFVRQHEDTDDWELDTATIAEERLTAADVTKVSIDRGFVAEMLEHELHENADADESDEVDIVEQSLQLRDFIKRNNRRR